MVVWMYIYKIYKTRGKYSSPALYISVSLDFFLSDTEGKSEEKSLNLSYHIFRK